jgi:hypothetical protein
MSYEDSASTSLDESPTIPDAAVSASKWQKQWFVSSILLGPAIGLTLAAILFYVTPKKFETKAELHFSTLHAGQTLNREMLEAEEQKIKDPAIIAEIESLILKMHKDLLTREIPCAEIETQIKGEIISVSVKHSDLVYARDVANQIVIHHQNRLKKDNDVQLLAADEMIDKGLAEQKKLPVAAQELLQLQSRLQLLERAKDRYEMMVAYTAEPSNFRNELVAYQRDYLKPDALTIDSTQAEIAAQPRKQDLDRRWLKLIGLMERHRKELETEVAQRQKNAPTVVAELPLLSEVKHVGLVTQVQSADFNQNPKEPVMTTYLLTGSVTGLLLLPLISLLGFVRSRNKSPKPLIATETL